MSRAEETTAFRTPPTNRSPSQHVPAAALTSEPALPVPVLGVLQPGQVPGVGKVHQQDELDDDEDEGAHHAKVVPDWGEEGGGTGPLVSDPQRRCGHAHNRLGPLPALKSPSGMKKAPTVIPTSTRNLKNQKLRQINKA